MKHTYFLTLRARVSSIYSPAAASGNRATLALATPARTPRPQRWHSTSPLKGWLPGLLLLVSVLLPVVAQAQVIEKKTTFNFVGAPQYYTVPAGITKLRVTATGAAGGDRIGGFGGIATGIITVVPGERLTVMVGGRGWSCTNMVPAFNNLGMGSPYHCGDLSTGGGGSTDLRRASGSATGDYLSTRNALIVAGGGGGSSGWPWVKRKDDNPWEATFSNGFHGVSNDYGPHAAGGSAGQINGAGDDGDGAEGGYGILLAASRFPAIQGRGATQSGIGGAGTSYVPLCFACYGHSGDNGSDSYGGNGSNTGVSQGGGGGGGGGGYWGGGGGGWFEVYWNDGAHRSEAGGGGAGSSWVMPTGSTEVVYSRAPTRDNGQLVIEPIFLVTSVSPAANAAAGVRDGSFDPKGDYTDIKVNMNFVVPTEATAWLKVYSDQRGLLRNATGPYSPVSTRSFQLYFKPNGGFLPGETFRATVTGRTQPGQESFIRQPRTWQFTTAVKSPSQGNFALNQAMLTDPNLGAYCLATGDLDNDGDLDLVSANEATSFLTVHLNNVSGNAPGTFTTQTNPYSRIPVGQVRRLELADVNQDGWLDVVALTADDKLVVSLGRLTGGAAVKSSLTLNAGASDLAVGDVDGDGDLDVAVSYTGSNSVSICLYGGESTGLGQSAATYSKTDVPIGEPTKTVALADVDNDGDLDLLAATSFWVKVVLNGGDQTGRRAGTSIFTNATGKVISTNVGGINNATCLAVGDMDGDGNLDIVAGSGGDSNVVSISRNVGNGVFGLILIKGNLYPEDELSKEVVVGGGSEQGPISLALADVDGDQDLDVVFNRNGLAPGLLLGYGHGTIGVYPPPVGGIEGGTFGRSTGTMDKAGGLAVVDVDGDGRLDLLATSPTQIGVYVNRDRPEITNFVRAGGPVGSTIIIRGKNLAQTTAVRMGELLAPITSRSATELTVTVPRVASTQKLALTAASGALAPGRLLLSATSFKVSRNPSTSFVLRTNNLGSLNQTRNADNQHAFPAFTDLDGDGLLDLLVGKADGTLSHYEQSAANSPDFVVRDLKFNGIDVGSKAAPAFTDLDGNGLLDLLVGSEDGTLRYFEQDRTNLLLFRPRVDGLTDINVGTESKPAFTDLDGDGLLDLLVGGGTTMLSHYEQSAANATTFVEHPQISTIRGRTTLTDLDGNGLVDMLMLDCNGNLTLNEQAAVSSENFTPRAHPITTIKLQPGGGATTFTDLDGDGLLDFIVGNSDGTLSHYEQEDLTTHVVSTAPGLNATTVAAGTNVALTYNRPVGAALAATVRVFSAQAGGRKAGSAAASGTTLTVNPTQNFKPGETVYVTAPATGLSDGTTTVPYVYQFTVATAVAPNVFANRTDYPTGANPTGVALGDLDDDGYQDLVTANSTGQGVSVQRGLNGGGFAARQDYPTGASPRGLVLGDVDSDGRLDIVTSSGSVVSVLRGQASGGFAAQQNYPSVSTPESLTLGDVNGDGLLDLLTVGSSKLFVRLGQAVGGFAASKDYPAGHSAESIALGDFNGDGILDVVTSNYSPTPGAGGISVLFGSAEGSFSNREDYVTAVVPRRMAVADLNGDGRLDIVAASYGGAASPGRVSVLLGQAGGGFTGSQEYPLLTVEGAAALVLGDLNGDGRLEIITANLNSKSVSVLLAQANGTYVGPTNYTTAGTTSYSSPTGSFVDGPSAVAVGDVDGDGDLDIVTANSSSHNASVLLNQVLYLSGTTPVQYSIAVPRSSNLALTYSLPVTTASVTNVRVFSQQAGGRKAVSVTTSGNTVTVDPARDFKPGETVFVTVPSLVRSKIGSDVTMKPYVYQFTTQAEPASAKFSGGADLSMGTATPRRVAVGDVDGDGDLDMVTANGSTVSVRLNDGTGNFGGGSDFALNGFLTSIALGDVDGDGDLDIMIGNGSGSASVRLNNGTGTFGGGSTFAVGGPLASIALGDVDGNGNLDLVAVEDKGPSTCSTCGSSSQVIIKRNDGTGNFPYISAVAVGSSPQSVTLGDVDGDGDLDLLAGNVLGNSASVRLNDGTGTFSGGSDPAVGNQPKSVALGDVDGDGDLDLVTANNLGGSVSVRLNNGAGIFSGGSDPAVGSSPSSVALGDVDGDGDLDILTANSFGNSVSVRLNNGAGIFSGGSDPAVGSIPSSIALGDVDGDGDLDILTANEGSRTVSVRLNQALPTLTSLSLASGLVGTNVTLTGTNLSGATRIRFNGTAATTFVATNSTTVTATVPTGATSGDVTVTTPNGTTNGLPFTVIAPDLTVSAAQRVAAGTYRTITVTGPATGGAGALTLDGLVTVTDALTVQPGGTLYTNCQTLTGAGSFTVAAGATLGICDPEGLSTVAGIGAVQTTGPRDFSTDAVYVYNGVEPQITGNNLPATVRELVVNSSQGLTLTQPVSIRQRVLLNNDFSLNGQGLTLLSDASGTALVVNKGGVVVGATGTMQRYIGTNTQLSGYRHYSSPVRNETFSTLAAGSYTPDFSGAAAYNSSATPGQVTPFPTVFAYDQDRILGSQSDYSNFDKGFEAPISGDQLLEVGRGYAGQVPGNILVDFTGQFTSDVVTRRDLNRYKNAQGTDVGMGWHLLGNPYPSPIDWSTMTIGNGEGDNLQGLNAAVYVVQSSGPYTGTYRTYLAQAPNDDTSSSIIPAGQGFFVRTTTAGTPGALRLTNSNRVTNFNIPQLSFGRVTADERALVRLNLRNAVGTSTDNLTLYADPKATVGLDAAYDATKLSNPSGLNLSSVSATGETLAIDGRPAFTSSTVIALRLSVPTAGTYTLTTNNIANIPAGLVAYLRDAATGQQVNLSSQPTTTVSLAAGLSTRYSVVFGTAGVLATAPVLTSAQVALYPNPASQSSSVQVTLPVAVGTRVARATVLNALGQVVSQTDLTVQAGQASGTLSTAGLATGVYVVLLQSGAEVVSKRLVID